MNEWLNIIWARSGWPTLWVGFIYFFNIQLPFLTPLPDYFLTSDRNCGLSAYDRINLTQFHYQINGKFKTGALCRRYEVMDWVIIPKKRFSRRPTACGHAPHMAHSSAPPTEAGSSPLAHAQNLQFHYQIAGAKLKNEQSNPKLYHILIFSGNTPDQANSTTQFHYQITSAKLKNEQSNPKPCPVTVIARSVSDKAISTTQFHYQITSAKPKNEHSNPKLYHILIFSGNTPDQANSTTQIHYQITNAKPKNRHSNPNPCPVSVIARSASDEAISTADPGNIFSKRNPNLFYNCGNNM